MGGWGRWLQSDNKAISVQLNLTGTATGIELGNALAPAIFKVVLTNNSGSDAYLSKRIAALKL